jgi:hypothetical protein
MIEALKGFPPAVAAFACKGQVTKQDYETVLVPAVKRALEQHDKVRLYYQVDADFAGIQPGAMWEDFMVGVEHWTRWERVAVVTDVAWIGHTMQAFSFLMPGQVKVFPLAQAAEARQWVTAGVA